MPKFTPPLLKLATPHAVYEALRHVATVRQKFPLARAIIESENVYYTLELFKMTGRSFLKLPLSWQKRAARVVAEKGNVEDLMQCFSLLPATEPFRRARERMMEKLVSKDHGVWLLYPTEEEVCPLATYKNFWAAVHFPEEVGAIVAAVCKLQDAEAAKTLLHLSRLRSKGEFLARAQEEELERIIRQDKAER